MPQTNLKVNSAYAHFIVYFPKEMKQDEVRAKGSSVGSLPMGVGLKGDIVCMSIRGGLSPPRVL